MLHGNIITSWLALSLDANEADEGSSTSSGLVSTLIC